MNSLSDVRLVLHGQEMQAQQARTRIAGDSRPAGFTRWQWFWHCQRTRRALAGLTPDQLRDIGLSAEQAREESLKAFWQR